MVREKVWLEVAPAIRRVSDKVGDGQSTETVVGGNDPHRGHRPPEFASPSCEQQSVFASLIHRAKALCDEDSLTQELEILTTVFKDNG